MIEIIRAAAIAVRTVSDTPRPMTTSRRNAVVAHRQGRSMSVAAVGRIVPDDVEKIPRPGWRA